MARPREKASVLGRDRVREVGGERGDADAVGLRQACVDQVAALIVVHEQAEVPAFAILRGGILDLGVGLYPIVAPDGVQLNHFIPNDPKHFGSCFSKATIGYNPTWVVKGPPGASAVATR